MFLRKNSKPPKRFPLLLESHERAAQLAASLCAAGQFRRALDLLSQALSLGKALHAHSIFSVMGSAAWRQTGFSRLTLRALEDSSAPAGLLALIEWHQSAQKAGAFPLALGQSGHARGKALVALSQASFMRYESHEPNAPAPELLCAMLIETINETPIVQASATLRACLSVWMSTPHNRLFQSITALVCSRLTQHPVWFYPVARPCAIDLLIHCGFESASPHILMALGEYRFNQLHLPVENMAMAQICAQELDRAGWQYSVAKQLGFPKRQSHQQALGDFNHWYAMSVLDSYTLASPKRDLDSTTLAQAYYSPPLPEHYLLANGVSPPIYKAQTVPYFENVGPNQPSEVDEHDKYFNELLDRFSRAVENFIHEAKVGAHVTMDYLELSTYESTSSMLIELTGTTSHTESVDAADLQKENIDGISHVHEHAPEASTAPADESFECALMVHPLLFLAQRLAELSVEQLSHNQLVDYQSMIDMALEQGLYPQDACLQNELLLTLPEPFRSQTESHLLELCLRLREQEPTEVYEVSYLEGIEDLLDNSTPKTPALSGNPLQRFDQLGKYMQALVLARAQELRAQVEPPESKTIRI